MWGKKFVVGASRSLVAKERASRSLAATSGTYVLADTRTPGA